jgi:hypothetical protein
MGGRMDAKSSIAQILQEQGNALSMARLLQLARAKGISDDAKTKAALWALIADSSVELTSDRSIVTAPVGANVDPEGHQQ